MSDYENASYQRYLAELEPLRAHLQPASMAMLEKLHRCSTGKHISQIDLPNENGARCLLVQFTWVEVDREALRDIARCPHVDTIQFNKNQMVIVFDVLNPSAPFRL